MLNTGMEQCFGCSACSAVCSENAIQMKTAENGFAYPCVDPECCSGCGRCNDVCPAQHDEISYPEVKSYLAFQAEKEERLLSTSGAVFPKLAKAVLAAGGVVFGAAYGESLNVEHRAAFSETELDALRQTKYVQSDPAETFRQVKELLEEGRLVMYMADPCTVAGLGNFVGNNEKLLLVDHICNGVPSPGFWKAYSENLDGFIFRGKTHPDNGHTVIACRNGDCTEEGFLENKFCRIYSKGIGLRNSCYGCRFCSTKRPGDISIGDFWGIENAAPHLNDGYGLSLVMIGTEKGRFWMQKIGEGIKGEYTREQVLQPRLEKPPVKPVIGRFFEKDLVMLCSGHGDLKTILKKYGA